MVKPELQHTEEQLNTRSFLLRLRKTIWLVPVAVLVGALCGALIYGCIWLSFSGQRQYEQTSKYYLTFGVEENGEVADYYNAYTWDELLFSDPAIYEVIEDELPSGMTLEEASEAIDADILTDVRILSIVVTSSDPSDVQQLTNAVEDALIRYGKNVEQFENIEFLSSTDVEEVIVKDRTRNAVLLGAFLGLLISVVWLWIRELLDDGIYVPEDAVRRYGIHVSLVLPAEGTTLPSFLIDENKEELDHLAKEKIVQLVSVDPEIREQAADVLTKQNGIQVVTRSYEKTEVSNDETQNKSAVLFVIPFGRANGTRTEHLMERLSSQGILIDSILLLDADGTFLQQYYASPKQKNIIPKKVKKSSKTEGNHES